ncbi:MAG: spermidine/putrescine ABC transporter substrate-binding protein [Legionellaceae bacterium]|nr:spermidine/putrescine ABC transporter substrate-binding protein [Legionellaceae bacterium]
MIFKRFLIVLCVGFLSAPLLASKTLNLYIWGGEIPKALIQTFEHETGINVNLSTYDSNETLYAKLKATPRPMYDVVLPSAYFVERLKKQKLLSQLDPNRLPNLKNLDPAFENNHYDPHNQYSIPLIWGITGIFYNQAWIKHMPTHWGDLWDSSWKGQLMLLDDPREVFGMALLKLGYHPNDSDPKHIEEAFRSLKTLAPNIKLFVSEGIQSILVDGDATVGVTWNADALKAYRENKNIRFTYPEEGFVLWIDCLAMLKNAPHPDEAYAFINFMLKASSAASLALTEGHAITNQAGKKQLPESIQNNPMTYPAPEVLKRGIIQRDLDEKTLELYNTYWQQLKFSL